MYVFCPAKDSICSFDLIYVILKGSFFSTGVDHLIPFAGLVLLLSVTNILILIYQSICQRLFDEAKIV